MENTINTQQTVKTRLGQIGWRFALMWMVMHSVSLTLDVLVAKLMPDIYESYSGYVTLALTVIAIYMIAFPILVLKSRKLPSNPPTKHKLGIGKWFLSILIVAGLAFMGMLAGLPIHIGLTYPFTGELTNELSEVMMSTNVFARAFVVGICAPVFEELMFRKILIDKLRMHGEYVCVVLSGLMFGLLHGNFSQFFFATAIGMFFAFIYLRTGNILYSISLHMAVNLTTSIFTTELAMKVLPIVENGIQTTEDTIWYLIYFCYIMGLLCICVAGIAVFFVFLNKMKLVRKEDELSHKDIRRSLLTTPKLWLYYICCLNSFVMSYLPNILAGK